jgi:integrase
MGRSAKALDVAERVLRDARKRGALTGEVPALKSTAPKSDRPRRSFLEAEQVAAVIHAADVIEAEHRGLTWETVALIRSSNRSAVALARELGVSDTLIRKLRRGELWSGEPERRNRNDVPRRVIIETLIFGGLRVSELCGLDGPHLDLRAGRLRVPRSATKSDAGERIVPIVPALQSRLTAHREQHPAGHGQPAFPTRNGTRQHPDNIRSRILAPIRERAERAARVRGSAPDRAYDATSLRRTFASILAVCDVLPRRAMYLILMGHTDPTLTLAVYQQVLDLGKGSVGLLEQTLGCTLPEARAIYNGEATRCRGSRGRARIRGGERLAGPIEGGGRRRTGGRNGGFPGRIRNQTMKMPRQAAQSQLSGARKPRLSGAFLRAAEGTRTLDLLHGKQTL